MRAEYDLLPGRSYLPSMGRQHVAVVTHLWEGAALRLRCLVGESVEELRAYLVPALAELHSDYI